jgi:CHAT domain-containing protein
VVLSCCSTGVPQEALADELVGFATGFELVGARAVIVSSWDIDDLSSSLVMVRFYALLGEGRDPGVALREAQLWVAGLTVADLDGLWAQAERAEPDALLPPGLAAEVSAFLLDDEQDPAARPFRHPAQFGGFLFHGPPPDLPSPRGGSSS